MLQPIDIKAKAFKKGIFGYKTTDVENFKEALYKEYEELFSKYEKMSADYDKLTSSLQENRLKMFELESKLAEVENVSTVGSDNSAAKAQADKIIKNAESSAKDIIAKAKAEAVKLEGGASTKTQTKVEPVKEPEIKVEAPKEETASSRFFKKAAEEAPAKKPFADDDDDDEIFVGEIEDARKPERMMIGDGEEEEEMDFEFL